MLEQEGGGWWGLEVLRAVTGVTDSGILHNVRLHKFFFFFINQKWQSLAGGEECQIGGR